MITSELAPGTSTHTGPTRGRAAHLGPQRRRPQVLDAALEIAAEHGVAAVTMAAIAEHMGVSRPVVYDCYSGRGDVLTALLHRETEVTLTRLQSMLPPPRTGTVEQLFVDGFRLMLTDVRERPASWRIVLVADPDPHLNEAVARGRVVIRAHIAAVLKPLLQRWQVAHLERSLPVLAELFDNTCESAARMLLDPAQHWDSPEQLAAIIGPAAYRMVRARS